MTNLLNSLLSSQELSALQQALTREQTRRRESNRLAAYRPYSKQTEFHAFGATCKQRLLRAGNQQGKTFSGAMEMAMHLTGLYPDWWSGRRFDHPIDAWAACDTGETARDNPQRALLGPLGHWGTGAIPERTILDLKRGRGVADLLDIVLVKHTSGGTSKLGFKRYDQGREAWQGPAKHVIWCDEEPPEDIYNEALARLIATGGMIYTTFTPLRGLSNVVKRLMDANDGVTCADINMTIEDALHIREEDRIRIMSVFPEHERDARIKGVPLMGTGRVFPVDTDRIRCQAFNIPEDWPQIGGLDFGWDHPFAAVKLAWDRDADCVYVTQTYRVRHETPVIHVAALRPWGSYLKFAWPHDGLATEKGSGEQLMKQYSGNGLKLLELHATNPQGGNRVEPGVLEMLDRMKTSRLKVFDHLADWFYEFDHYHRDNGLIVKKNDDLISATRIALMMITFATPPEPDGFTSGQTDIHWPVFTH